MVSHDLWHHCLNSPLQPISSSLPLQPSSAAACTGHWTAGSAETGHTPWDQAQHCTESPAPRGGCAVLSVLQPACHCLRRGGECWITWRFIVKCSIRSCLVGNLKVYCMVVNYLLYFLQVVRVWELCSGKCVFEFSTDSDSVSSLAIDHTGKR